MNVHIALYKWKPEVSLEAVEQALSEVRSLADKVPGIIGITTARNGSRHSEGFTHVIYVRGENQAVIDAYRALPDHAKVASRLDKMEDVGIGVDFEVDENESASYSGMIDKNRE